MYMICMCICVYMYMDVYACMCVCVYVYDMHVYMRIYVYGCVCMYVYMCMCVYVYDVHVYMRIYVYGCVNMYMGVYTCMCVCVYVYGCVMLKDEDMQYMYGLRNITVHIRSGRNKTGSNESRCGRKTRVNPFKSGMHSRCGRVEATKVAEMRQKHARNPAKERRNFGRIETA